jgi:formamidopyrimidine-DNA glycosylase
MPEGPEVETVRRTLAPLVVGARLGRARVSQFALRTAVTARDLAFLHGAVVDDVGRHGKLLWLRCGDAGLCVRLGMTGRITVEPKRQPARKHTHVRIALDDGQRELRFCDPRRFGDVVPFASLTDLDAERARLGPDGIVLNDIGRHQVVGALQRTGRSVKDALLDQAVIAGVGNIYASEACFIAGIDPTRRGTSLTNDEAIALVRAAEVALHTGVNNRGTSFSDYVDADGQRGSNAQALLVFQREGEACTRCGAVVVRCVQGARSTFFCPGCQH